MMHLARRMIGSIRAIVAISGDRCHKGDPLF